MTYVEHPCTNFVAQEDNEEICQTCGWPYVSHLDTNTLQRVASLDDSVEETLEENG